MTASSNSPLSLPLEAYDLTAADKQRFGDELRLGMVSPHDPLLSVVSREVPQDEIGSARVQAVIERLLTIAGKQQHGKQQGGKRRMLVGLAAPQIGELLCICVVDTQIDAARKRPGKLECFINPTIIRRSRNTEEGREGCFSAGPVWGLVRRASSVTVRAFTPEGVQAERTFEGFTARIMQHEYDHLQGIRFPDRIRTDRKRHWVHTEELSDYPEAIERWPRTCSRARWEAFKTNAPHMNDFVLPNVE
jgi:peptide deformylase